MPKKNHPSVMKKLAWRDEKAMLLEVMEELKGGQRLNEDFWPELSLKFQQNNQLSSLSLGQLKNGYMVIKGENRFQTIQDEYNFIVRYYTRGLKNIEGKDFEPEDSKEKTKFEEDVKADVFCQAYNDMIYQRKFYFFVDPKSIMARQFAALANSLVHEYGGAVVEDQTDLSNYENLDCFVVAFTTDESEIQKFMESHQHDIYCPSLIFEAVDTQSFDSDSKHIFRDHLRFVFQRRGDPVLAAMSHLPVDKSVPFIDELVARRKYKGPSVSAVSCQTDIVFQTSKSTMTITKETAEKCTTAELGLAGQCKVDGSKDPLSDSDAESDEFNMETDEYSHPIEDGSKVSDIEGDDEMLVPLGCLQNNANNDTTTQDIVWIEKLYRASVEQGVGCPKWNEVTRKVFEEHVVDGRYSKFARFNQKMKELAVKKIEAAIGKAAAVSFLEWREQQTKN